MQFFVYMEFVSLVDVLVRVDQVSQETRIVAFQKGFHLPGGFIISSIALPGWFCMGTCIVL